MRTRSVFRNIVVAGLGAAFVCGGTAEARDVVSGPLLLVPPVLQPVEAHDIVGVRVLRHRAAGLQGRAITFGQVFVAGKLRASSKLAAAIGGVTIPAQLDVKATNADGSVRMGVVTLILPADETRDDVPVMLVTAPRSGGSAVEFASSRDEDLTVDISVQGGPAVHLSAAQLLARAPKNPDYWLHGPLASEIRLDAPVTGSLHVTFDIRAYANGSNQADIAFKNDYAMQPVGGGLTYDVVIQKGGKTVFAKTGVTQPQYTHWHKTIGGDTAKDVTVVEDVAALEKSGAVLDYDLTTGVLRGLIDRNLAMMAGPGFDILGNAGVVMYMGVSGERSDIGPLTMVNTIWLLTQRVDAQIYALAQADAAGSVPWHFFNPQQHSFWTVAHAPKMRAIYERDRTKKTGLQTLTQPPVSYTNNCGCWWPEQGHQPDLSFLPYIMTGSRYYLDQLEAQATWDVLLVNPQYRQYDKGIVVYPSEQVRSKAWSLRGIVNAAWIIPDSDPLKDYFVRLQANNFGNLKSQIRSFRQGQAEGWFPGDVKPSEAGSVAPWQEEFLTLVVALAAKRGVPDAMDVLKWQSNFLAGRFISGDKGLSPYDGASYRIYTYAPPDDVSGAYKTWAEVAAATAAHGQSGGGTVFSQGTTVRYLQEAKGALAQIVRLTGSAEARKAYSWLDEHATTADKRSFQLDPTFLITPNH